MSPHEIKQRIKARYDQLPYPGIESNAVPTENWSWVSVDWIGSLMPSFFDGDPPFKRILVAGCGTGNEAFQMQNRFPNAEITAVDYSEKSIRIAQEYQKKHPEYARIRFEVSDLTDGESNWVRNGSYDFICCHGTMSYISDLPAVFGLFAECLCEDGILYLGVNGAAHSSITLRESFEYLGHKPYEFEDSLETRRLIELLDRLRPSQSHIANHTSAYLDSDILNTFSLNLSLSEWIEYAEKSGLHFVSNTELIPSFARTLSPNIFSLLFPKSRKELCKLIAINNIAAFHRLIFSKRTPPPIPWSDFEKLLDCEFQTTRVYTLQNALSDIYGELIINANIGHGHDVNFRWPVEDLSIKLLGQTEGSRRIKDAIGDSIDAYKENEPALLLKLFMFYHLGIIKILPNSHEAIYT